MGTGQWDKSTACLWETAAETSFKVQVINFKDRWKYDKFYEILCIFEQNV